MGAVIGLRLWRSTASGRRHAWSPAVLVVLLLVACTRGGRDLPDVGLEIEIAPQPPHVGPATVTVVLTDAASRPLEGARVELEGNMSHAGMVPVLATAAEIAPGRYQAGLEFTMGGDWFILVRAHLADGRSMERRVDVPGVGDSSTAPMPEKSD